MGDFLQMRALTFAERGLNGLVARQNVTAANIANASIPGYKAGRLDFEKQLENAMGKGFEMKKTNPGHISPSVEVFSRVTAGSRLDGNSVNLDKEIMTRSATSLRYQAVTTALIRELGKLKIAINGDKFGKEGGR